MSVKKDPRKPVVHFFTYFREKFTLNCDFDLWSRSSSLGSLNVPLLDCTLIPSIKFVGEIAYKIWPIV